MEFDFVRPARGVRNSGARRRMDGPPDRATSMSDARRFFDGYAPDFDAIYGAPDTFANRIVNRLFRRSMRARFEMTMARLAPVAGKSILDVGCGPGHYAVALARSGAARVTGIDFAPEMIRLAIDRSAREGLADRCAFLVTDFLAWQSDERFDCSVLMGLMDYVVDPVPLIAKVIAMTRDIAVFSFPVAAGPLAAQRRWRYRNRCPLYMYRETQLRNLFARFAPARFDIERIGRDYFVTLHPPAPQPDCA